jgi:large subunit ribosomal protein L30
MEYKILVKHMKKIKITQVRSGIGRPLRQKRTLVALGLRKMHQTVEKEATPQIIGMVAKVQHLVSVEELAE